MGLDRYLRCEAEWIDGTAKDADIVISTRIRLARNFAGIHFGDRATPKMKGRVLEYGQDLLERSQRFRGGELHRFGALTPTERLFFVERHMVSPTYADAPGHVGLIVGPSEAASAVLNEEDHLRLQVIRGGFAPRDAWDQISGLDDELEIFLPYSFSERWGYLTACPTNTGTGMRVSALIHLPGLVLNREIGKVLRGVSHVNLVVRGFYGEGTDVMGNLFQISNQRTLGVSEEHLIEQLERVTQHVIEYEKRAREALLAKGSRDSVEDRVWRAIGELKSARLLTSKEMINLASVVRMGVSLGMIQGLSLRTLNEIVLLAQPAHLQVAAGRELTQDERDGRRSRSVREKLADFHL